MKKLIRPEFFLALLCILFFAAGLASLNTMVVYTPDSARYLIWANSLAKFSGFEDSSAPELSRYVVHGPLYSVMLAPSQMIFPNSIEAGKIATLLFGVLAVLVLFVWLKEKTSGWYALLGCALFATNPMTFIYSTQILSEIPFIVCFLLFFIAGEKIIQEPDGNIKTAGTFIVTILLCVLTREIGIALLFAAVFFLVLQNKYKSASIAFGVTAFIYLLWFIRNEIVIASFENPVMQNSKVFWGHLYTATNASMLTEFAVRCVSNIKVYSAVLWRALYFPDYFNRTGTLIPLDDPIIVLTKNIFPYIEYELVCCTIGCIILGLWSAKKSLHAMSLMPITCICIFIPILLYPINDNRFMFPLFVILLLVLLLGLKYFIDRLKKSAGFRKIAVPGCLCLAACWILPQAAWLESYVSVNHAFGQSPKTFSEHLIQQKHYPEVFSRPVGIAGKWIASHSDSSVIVLSRWKELTFTLAGRKLIQTDADIMPDVFDRCMRDYHVRYLVSVIMNGGVGEFDGLMSQSRFCCFRRVFCAGTVEVYEIDEKNGRERSIEFDSSYSGVMRTRFSDACRTIEKDPQHASDEFNHLEQEYGPFRYFVFESAVAKEFLGQMDSAVHSFESFRSAPQAGAYIHQGWYHQEIISRLKAAGLAAASYDRANRYYIAAVNYWEMGYRLQALKILERSFREDTTFFPSLIFQSVFSLENGDTLAAKEFYKKAASLNTGNKLITKLRSVWSAFDSLHSSPEKQTVIRLHLRIAASYRSMGVNEMAIDEFEKILKIEGGNIDALSALADLYEMKQRWYPAYQCTRRLLLADPNNLTWKEKCAELEKRL